MTYLTRYIAFGIALLTIYNVATAHGDDMNFSILLSPVPPEAKFESKDYYIWGGSMVQDPKGKCHLFYSRWPRSKGFQAWVTHSEIAKTGSHLD